MLPEQHQISKVYILTNSMYTKHDKLWYTAHDSP